MIVGFLKAKKGTILLNGEDVTELPMYIRSKKGTGLPTPGTLNFP